ncbi:EF-hand domain-containing protein [Gimesia panareensis]|uniref:EF hand n=1 Tax=Gimesia panareensis TaxID=2527978 RepID=A0A518ADJ8_9PLAN|nr:hypothetical protein [Gimesia panareensis]QDT29810.1 EF hand [Gimesia panareensis]QDU52799.1 EF hand [Gimesia panareensis]
MFRFVRYFIPFVLLVTFSSDLAFAQPGGDSRSRGFMSFLDRNRNGVIEPDEFQRMPSRFREMLESAGVDTSRSMTAQEYERVMPRILEQMRSRRGSFGGDRGDSDSRRSFSFSRGPGGPGFGGPPGSFSRSSDDGDDDRRGGYDRDSMRSRYGSFQPDRGSDDSSSRSRSSSSNRSSSSKSEPSKPVRTTVDLNKDFVPHDTDQDGQIGLYEWRKNNPGKLADFFTMDLNGDGYLTPKEIQLSKAGTPQRSAASFMFALNTGQPGTSPAAPQGSSQTAAPSTKPEEKTAQPTAETKPAAPSSDPMVSQANYFFKLLDRNKDSSISAEEWQKSRSMRRMFDEANIDLTVTMSQEQFVKHYVTIKSN